MYAVIYLFEIKKGQDENFISLWKQLTNSIKEHAGGLGSVLHKKNETHYVAYAKWPDKVTFESANDKFAESITILRNQMRESMVGVTVLEKFEIIEDLLS